jgi:hypothetical protein
MSQFRKSRIVAMAAASLAAAFLTAAPASAQYYYDRGYAPEPEYASPGYGRRGYGPPPGAYGEPRGYGPPQGYGPPRGYGGQGGVYFDKETAKRNARALKEQQKDAIKSGRGAYVAPGYTQPGYQAPRGGGYVPQRGGGGYPVPQPGRTAGQNGVPDDPYRNRN